MLHSLALFSAARRFDTPCMITQRGASVAPALPSWTALARKEDVLPVRLIVMSVGLPARALFRLPPGLDSSPCCSGGAGASVLPRW